MKKLAIAVLALAGGFALGPVNAQSIAMDCGGSNWCFADITGVTYDTVAWSFDKNGTDALIPRNCTNSYSCEFYCPKRPGSVYVTVRAVNNSQIVASATSLAACTAEPL